MRVEFTFKQNPMRSKKLSSFIPILAATILLFSAAKFARANSVSHIIINEIRPAGSSKNEFVELFNPTDTSIDLNSYKLTKKTKMGTESTLLSPSKFLGVIPAHGYFLIAHPDYKDAISADLAYSGSTYYITDDNTVLLYDEDGTLADKIGYGLATDSEVAPAPNPSIDQSVERSNFSDTGNNATDFSINFSPSPKNSSQVERSDEEPQGGNDNNQNNAPENTCTTYSLNIRLSEIFPYPANRTEFVEIKNTDAICVDVSGWKIIDDTGHKKEFPEDSIINPGEYLILEGNLYLNNDSDTVYILNKNGNTKTDALDSRFFEKAKKDFSYSLDNDSWFWTLTPTPDEKNTITTLISTPDNIETTDTDTNENLSLSDKVHLNEIFPNPKKDPSKEYVEIKNDSSEPVDLYKWSIHDRSRSGKYVFKEHVVVEPDGYFTVYKTKSKLALNNSEESVYLYSPKNELASSVTFEKSSKNSSYSFNGKKWKWTKYATPGKKNRFDSAPAVKIKKPKNVFKDIIAEFSVKAKDKETKKLKYAWDFGDGKKSYLKKTTHKYQGTGKYIVILSVSDDSQTVEKSFVVSVKKSPRLDLEIVKIVPNPAGKDSDGETVDIRNNSGKKASLDGWKIATGSSEKIYNHPISGEIFLESGKTETLRREFSKFSLNNKAGKVILVSPDGKVIDRIEYSKEKIADDEAYAKINDEWQWIPNDMEEKPENIDGETEFVDDPTGEKNEAEDNTEDEGANRPVRDASRSDASGEVLGAMEEKNSNDYAPTQTTFSSEDAFIFFSSIGFLKSVNEEPNYCPLRNPPSSLKYLFISSL
jgi:hypothetical protein